MKKSPKQKLIDLAGVSHGKDEKWSDKYSEAKKIVAAKIAAHLDPKDGEKTAELETRIARISNLKLLRLHAFVERLKADFSGSKANLVNAVFAHNKDRGENYKKRLAQKSLGSLLSLHDRLAKASK